MHPAHFKHRRTGESQQLMNTMISLSIAMAAGLLFSRLVKRIGLPNVTAYLVAGLLVGPYVLDLVSHEQLASFSILTDVALGFIAFSIGGEFKLSHIKQIGGSSLIITFFQAITACLLVDVVLLIAFPGDPALAITLGAIATATAPAATLMVVRQYKAKGPVTGILLPVVALDDAIGLMIFSVSLALAKVFAQGTAPTVETMLLEPLLEIFGSLLIGFAIGVVLAFAIGFFHSRGNRITIVIAAVFLGVGLSQILPLSSLLVCMAIGAGMCNLQKEYEKVLDFNERWTTPLFMIFFVISGAELDLSVLPAVGLLGVLYLVARSVGKYLGAFLGARVVKADKNIQKYLGICLLPQAGVAIGMSQIVVSALPEYGAQIRAVVLCATLVYELVGPLLTKMVLTKAGEIAPATKRAKVTD
ncbi:MAG: cation:proton antiporter [Clostridia bacterium]|nr:cation:proton antiporter [Clostridia bacterium]